jgi:transcriptional regulator with XRE-family HTH domain
MEPHNKLAALLRAENISQAEMARRCGYDRSNFHRLLSGKLSPSLTLAARIERETNGAIPAVAWAALPGAGDTSHGGRYPAGGLAFPHRHLLAIGQLQTHEILYLLDEAEQWVALNRQASKHSDTLAGLTIINAFFENSTRTLLSFEIAGKRLGADVVNMHAAQSSVKKGETLIDTAVTLNSMRADAIFLRLKCCVSVALMFVQVEFRLIMALGVLH